MGNFVTEGLYNSEVNHYTAYGSEPVIGDFTMWGHFTQVVWKSTDSVGCYTADCTAGGLANAGGSHPSSPSAITLHQVLLMPLFRNYLLCYC